MPAPLVKYVFFFPLDIFCFLVKYQVFRDMWIDIRVFYSAPLVFLSVLMTILGCFQYWLKSGIVRLPEVLLLYRIILAILGFLFFIWTWVLFFQSLWRILLGFWWALYSICRLLLVRNIMDLAWQSYVGSKIWKTGHWLTLCVRLQFLEVNICKGTINLSLINDILSPKKGPTLF